MSDQERDLLREIGETTSQALERVRQAEHGERPWTNQREEAITRFVADWGDQILARVARGEVSVAELAARKRMAERALRAPEN